MDWLFDNLGKLAPVVIFLLYMISSMKGKGPEQEEPDDPQAAERARKIQEEIRRKILERQRGDAAPTAAPPKPIVFEEAEEEDEYERPVYASRRSEPVVEEVSDPSPNSFDAFEERRREIEAKLEEAKEARRLAKKKASSIAKGRPLAPIRDSAVSDGEIRTRLRRSLGDRNSLKTAIVLREVLDTPVGMR